MQELEIRHEVEGARGGFVIDREGQRIAEMTYVFRTPGIAVFNHTFVDDSLRGLGIARKLMDAAVVWARESGTRIQPTCSYVVAQFAKDASIKDVQA